MEPSLMDLMEDLVRSIEQREAAVGGSPALEADDRIGWLERELVARLADRGLSARRRARGRTANPELARAPA